MRFWLLAWQHWPHGSAMTYDSAELVAAAFRVILASRANTGLPGPDG